MAGQVLGTPSKMRILEIQEENEAGVESKVNPTLSSFSRSPQRPSLNLLNSPLRIMDFRETFHTLLYISEETLIELGAGT